MNKLIKFVNSKLTAQQSQTIANVVMCLGVVINLLDMLQNGLELKWGPALLAIGLVLIGYIYQLIFVRCPHCGDTLKGHKNKTKLPERCPNCKGRLDKLPKKPKAEI